MTSSPLNRNRYILALLSLLLPATSTVALAAGGISMPPLTSRTAEHIPLAKQAMAYFDAGSDPFHAVQTSADMLKNAGFTELAEAEPYQGNIKPGGKYFFTRDKSTLVAFAVGEKYAAGNGFKIIGGHTDSPNLRVKPRSKRTASGTIQLGVECYGGGLWHTWFDRDLGISGRVLVRNGSDGKIVQRLVKIDRALLRISNLAIHLLTVKEREAFSINKEDHMSPILALEAKKALSGNDNKDDKKEGAGAKSDAVTDGWTEYQEPALLQLLAMELDVDVKSIVDFELSLFDVQKAALGGVFSEFVHSARLDNLASCFIAVQALVDHVNEGLLVNDEDISMVVLYDHEEVGSSSAVGAASPIMGEAVRRISTALDGTTNPDVYESCLRKSFVLSSDQAHAVHPNYAAKHEKSHQPKMNQGMVIKRNSNQRYATTTMTGLLIREIAKQAGLPPVQEFMVRQDCGCGSTIGPLISASTGIRAIDMGCPQLSMHSIRETMGICDLTNGLDLFKAYFRYFREVDSSIEH
jgi:aspartyl aminopeptidase